ncbi:MAG: S8 family serine peptidase [Elusimicrobia bacterium]|nr:S8 family serine peptidase [Elusimicrobiota bacterium]
MPRGNVSAIRKYVSSHAKVLSSQSNFQTHLMDSAELQEVPPVWQLGITGAAGSIFWIDTGGDATHEDFGGRLDVVDMVDEGPEDWIGHGTHVAGISLSGTPGFLGMAKAAVGVMAKVFSRDQAGASDGDIMAAASIAMKKGSDVISLSLGSRGSSADNLAEFFSELTLHKNAAGEYPIITASAGNSGPFDRTLSQPAAGVRVIAVAAAAKSKDDGQPEIAFYSSVGPDIDRRYAIKRYRFKPELTGIGGDVVTKLFSAIVYLFGVFSTRSKDAPRAPSDMENGKHTGMSGTSMSNPAVAAIAELVKLAMRKCGAITPFVAENMPFAMKAVLMRTARDMGVPVWFQGAGLVSAKAAVSLVAQSGTRALGTGLNRAWNWLTGSTPIATEASWAWLERLKAVEDAEDRAYRVVELTKNEAQARQEAEDPGDSEEPGENPSPEEEAPADSEEPAEQPSQNPDAEAKRQRRFNDARNAEAPLLISALKDEVWLVRLRAAVALMNLKAPAAVEALAEAGLHDPDARVRQMAFLALAEIPTHAVDSLLQRAAAVESWDVGAYAAYALIRRGDRSMIGRIVKELGNRDKRARFTATWLLGQIGGYASAVEAEGLSARVRDRDERGNIRHLAAAALSNLADAAPETLSDPVVANLLDAAGAENLALTRTINKIFPVAVRSKAFVARLRSAPLKPIVTDFVIKNRDAIGKPGALSELVQLLARAAGVPLDAPTAPMDPTGKGVVGVDETMGPVDLLIVPPSRAPQAFRDESDPEGLSRALSDAGLDPALLSRFESAGRAALPLSRAFVLSVPEHKLYALTIVLEHRGWLVRRSLAYYSLSRGPAEAGGTIVNLGDGAQRPVIAADADVSLVRLRASAGVSEARVMSALERVAQVGRGRGPSVVALSLAAPTTRRTLLSTLVDRLVAAGVGVVAGSGNGGPRKGTVSAPGDSALAVIVAAASRAGLQFYSSRGTPEAPRVTWADLVDDLQPADPLAAAQAAGTSVAAERSAAKLADLARTCAEAFAAQGRALPDGWFPYIVELVKSSLTAMPSHGAHEVGGGLFDAPQRAQELLRERLIDPDAVERDARALAEKARGHVAPKAAPR